METERCLFIFRSDNGGHVQKLSQPGFVIEASGALSWVLRKNEVPFMSDLNEIMDILEVGVRNETITINPNFNAKDKNTQHYTHEYYGSNHSLLFQNQETLFGIGGCTFKETGGQKNCDRESANQRLKRTKKNAATPLSVSTQNSHRFRNRRLVGVKFIHQNIDFLTRSL